MKVTTGIVRIAYPHLFKPTKSEENDEPKFRVCILIPKDDEDTIKLLKKAIRDAIANENCFNGKKLSKHEAEWGGIRDGDEDKPDIESFAGHYYLNASSKRAPFLKDRNLGDILDEEELYPGCYCRVALNTFAFNFKGKIGIAFGLNGVQKRKDGERLGGSFVTAEEAFDDGFEDDEDDEPAPTPKKKASKWG